jgi:hypothetical protein
MQISLRALALLLPAVLFACDKHDADHHDGDKAGEHAEEGEHTHAPLIEGGALVELGDHEGNLEVHLKPDTGALEIYLVDGHATDYVRSSQASLAVTVQPATGAPFTLTLAQIASTLSGETVGDSSKYAAQDDRLKGLKSLKGKVATVKMKGSTYPDIEIAWPAAEQDGDH